MLFSFCKWLFKGKSIPVRKQERKKGFCKSSYGWVYGQKVVQGFEWLVGQLSPDWFEVVFTWMLQFGRGIKESEVKSESETHEW